jgi:hypothetical protein
MTVHAKLRTATSSSFPKDYPGDAARLAGYQARLAEQGMGLSYGEATDFMGIVMTMGQNKQIAPGDVAQLRLNGIMLAVKHRLGTDDPLYAGFLDTIAAADTGAAAPPVTHVTREEKLALFA